MSLVDLPRELLFHHLLSRVPLVDVISFFSLDRSSKAISTDLTFWSLYLGDLDYRTTQQLFIDWAIDGRLAGLLCDLTITLINNLDERTLLIIVMRLVENGHHSLSARIRTAIDTQKIDTDVLWPQIDYIDLLVNSAALIIKKIRLMLDREDESYMAGIEDLRHGLKSLCRDLSLYHYLTERIVDAIGLNGMLWMIERTTKYAFSTESSSWAIEASLKVGLFANSGHSISVDRSFNRYIASLEGIRQYHTVWFDGGRSKNISYMKLPPLSFYIDIDYRELVKTDPWVHYDPIELRSALSRRPKNTELVSLVFHITSNARKEGYSLWADLFDSIPLIKIAE